MNERRPLMVKVKICGITRLDEAIHAIDHGADMLGFNFYDRSPRYLSPDVAGKIIERLSGHVEKVGVFVNSPATMVSDLANAVGLTAVQLHGSEDSVFIDRLRDLTDALLIKAIRVTPDFNFGSAAEYQVDAILLDAYSADQYGGTGDRFDWSLAAEVRRSVSALYLAGGLTPDNVAKAIRQVRPFAVDVASGVESSPGKKDPEKVEAFIRNAKHA